MIDLTDTHCHIQFSDYPLDAAEVIENANANGVGRMLCVGCTLKDSEQAIQFSKRFSQVYAAVGLHPHEASVYVRDEPSLQRFRQLVAAPEVVAIGECGLDYFYNHSSASDQKQLLRFQLEVARQNGLPLIFHVREAFEDFWELLDDYEDIRGVIHSFSSTESELKEVVKRGLYIGLNGIMTFTKVAQQLEAAKMAPLDRIVLETDAPFLTPVPFRGKICEPKHLRSTAEFLSRLRSESLEQFALVTTENAARLFNLK